MFFIDFSSIRGDVAVRYLKIIVEKHPEGYVPYPLGKAAGGDES